MAEYKEPDESRGAHQETDVGDNDFTAYHEAVKARLIDILASPYVEGLRGAVETMADPEYPLSEREEYLLVLLTSAYSRGRIDGGTIATNPIIEEDLKIIAAYDSTLEKPAD